MMHEDSIGVGVNTQKKCREEVPSLKDNERKVACWLY